MWDMVVFRLQSIFQMLIHVLLFMNTYFRFDYLDVPIVEKIPLIFNSELLNLKENEKEKVSLEVESKLF